MRTSWSHAALSHGQPLPPNLALARRTLWRRRGGGLPTPQDGPHSPSYHLVLLRGHDLVPVRHPGADGHPPASFFLQESGQGPPPSLEETLSGSVATTVPSPRFFSRVTGLSPRAGALWPLPARSAPGTRKPSPGHRGACARVREHENTTARRRVLVWLRQTVCRQGEENRCGDGNYDHHFCARTKVRT